MPGGLFSVALSARSPPPGISPAPCPSESGLSSNESTSVDPPAAARPAPPRKYRCRPWRASAGKQPQRARLALEQIGSERLHRRAAGGEPVVDALVGERVRVLVALPRDVLVGDPFEPPCQIRGLSMQPLQPFVLHLEAARQLLNEQAAIRAKEHVGGSELRR